MTFIHYYQLREVEGMNKDLKKENNYHLAALSKVMTLHDQNFEVACQQENILKAREESNGKLHELH